MARVEIALPDQYLFGTEISIRIGDVNYGGHLGNDAVLSIAQEARMRFLRAHGWATELTVDGVGMMMVDAAIVYLAEGTYGMTLRVEIAAADIRSRSFDLLYRVTNDATGGEIARVKTGLVFYDLAARRVVSLPPRFRAVLAGGP